MRYVLPLIAAAITGCGAAGPPQAARLTADEKAAWARLASGLPRPAWIVVRHDRKARCWRAGGESGYVVEHVLCYDPPGAKEGLGLHTACERAEEKAREPGCGLAAVVDVHADPLRPILWYTDDGSGPKESDRPPADGRGLTAWLVELQRRAPLERP
jgi:hypothetical protein